MGRSRSLAQRNRLSAFYAAKLADNPTPPPVVLTEFELFNEPVKIGGKDSPLRQAINVASRITLRYDQSVFRFQFAALDFTAPQAWDWRSAVP